MDSKKIKLIYWISTGLFSTLMVLSGGNHFFNTEYASTAFTNLNFPGNVVYAVGACKWLGVIAIWFNIKTKKFELFKNLAYAGYFYLYLLALTANIIAWNTDIVTSFRVIMDIFIAPVILISVSISYLSEKKLNNKS